MATEKIVFVKLGVMDIEEIYKRRWVIEALC